MTLEGDEVGGVLGMPRPQTGMPSDESLDVVTTIGVVIMIMMYLFYGSLSKSRCVQTKDEPKTLDEKF